MLSAIATPETTSGKRADARAMRQTVRGSVVHRSGSDAETTAASV